MSRGALAVAFAGCLISVPLAPASASCAAASGPEGSPIIFVGTAEDERGGYTRFTVSEVWEGPDLAAEVWVLSGQQQPSFPFNLISTVASSVDADFTDGERYLVGADGEFETNACRVQEMSTVPADQAPPNGVREPTGDGATGADPPLGPVEQGLLVSAVLALMISSAVLWRRRRHTTPD